jgi:hypothetical protein
MGRRAKYNLGDYINGVFFWNYAAKVNGNWKCKFLCGCGRTYLAFLNNVKSGHTKRCGQCRVK